jgi:hypothetical protein
MKLLIVIINYRTGDLTIDCLRSLRDQVRNLPGVRVVVSDNASGDGSLEQIETAIRTEGWSDWVSTMPLPRNGGFAYGNNEPIRAAMRSSDPPEYLFILNPDTIVRPGAIATMLDFMDRHPAVGIAGTRLEDPDGRPQSSAFRFPSIFGEIDLALRLGWMSRILRRHVVAPPPRDTPHQCDWVAAASMMIRRQMIEQVGLMDEKFFMYFEETDFCRRARKKGWSCWHVPSARIVHFVGKSSGVTDPTQTHRRRPRYWFESRHHYFVKNHGELYAALTDAAFAICFLLWRLRRKIQNKPDHDPPRFLRDLLSTTTMHF